MNVKHDAARAYAVEFGGAMLAYSVSVPLSIWAAEALSGSSWRYPVVLIPLIPSLLALWAFVRFLSRMDELQRRIQFEALGVAFGGTGLLTFSYGFLEGAGFPHLSWIFILPLMIAIWGISTAAISWKYR